MEELKIGDKMYLSSKRASEITGYAKDYIGQLCREGRVQATLVGRSWYVLESSIREHRFGAPEAVAAIEEAPVAPGISSTWTSPTYNAERIEPIEGKMPQSPGVNAFEVTRVPQEEENEGVLENMQSAWQDWFKSRGESAAVVETHIAASEPEEPTESLPDPIVISKIEEDRQEDVVEEGQPVNISIFKEEETEESVSMVDSYSTNAYEAEDLEQESDIPRKPSYVASSLMLVVAGVAVLVAFIGSGSFDFVAKHGGIQAGTIYYLSGTSEIK